MEKIPKFACLSETLSSCLRRLGKKIAQHPYYFIIIPSILSALLSVGFLNMKCIHDNNYLLSADRGNIFEIKQFIEKTFPMNTSKYFDFQRFTHRPFVPMIYIKHKEDKNMLDRNVLLEVRMLHEIANNVTAYIDGRQIGYNDVCGRTYEKCFENPISTLLNHLDEVVSKRMKFRYPIDLDPLTKSYKILIYNLGGVIVDGNDYIEKVHAMRLMYPLDDTNTSKSALNKAWNKALYRRIKECNFKYIQTFFEPFGSIDDKFMSDLQEIIPFVSVTIIVICFFSVLSNMTNSWIRSKPWMGVASVTSAGMAVAASFGLLFACGIESTYYNVALPFAILVTEVDDSFVMVACWRTTNTCDPVEKRMEETYSKAAVSITITSLTNFCSYCIAMNCPFPVVRIFGYYAATCICFTYFFQLTFFGGCLALSGYREEKGLNPLSCKSVSEFNTNYRYEEEKQEDIFMQIFKNKVASLFSYWSSQIIILLVYIVSLSFGIWGVISLNEGFDVFGFYPENTDVTRALRVYYKYFTEYPFSIQIVLNDTLDYSNPDVQKSLDEMINKFQSHPNVADIDISWLKYYKEFQNHPSAKYLLMGYDLSNKQDFIDALRQVYMKFTGSKHYHNDIVFNHNYTDIICSRFFLLAKNVADRTTELKLINDIQEMAEKFPFSVFTHTMISPFVEQGIIITQVVFQVFWLTSLINLVIFIFFHPNIFYSVVVALCISSITIQTLGYMSLWGVDLDIVSMFFLLICMGYCVNYPTHICYSFLTSSDKSIKGKLQHSFYNVGFPIFQGAFSTGIGLLILLHKTMFLNKVFVKIIVLIATQTAFHALFLIPVLFSMIWFCRYVNKARNNAYIL